MRKVVLHNYVCTLFLMLHSIVLRQASVITKELEGDIKNYVQIALFTTQKQEK